MMMDAFEGTAASTPSRLKRLDSACSHSWFTKVLYSLGPQGFGCSRIWDSKVQKLKLTVSGSGLRTDTGDIQGRNALIAVGDIQSGRSRQ